ncbi:amino acid ABC transporter substrate-binding protein [Candidatus Woesearchaeota archaeon]|nr:amino acid ABC transporter substrate-binding protein [Candidatus Pacearchaeota archaeon]MBI4451786.1 amino acid ABC transporter substrate-binding protein [Candidatus Woesearchaeota archaeon]
MKKDYVVMTISVIAIIIALFALFRAPTGVAPIEKSTFDNILEKDEIMVCYMTWPPSVIKDPNTGKLSGFMIDIFEEVAKDADLKVKYTESTWGGFPADLNTGKCDAAIAGIYPTIGRSTSVSFTKPFFYAGNSGVVKAGETRFKTIEDLNKNGVKIAVIQGEYGHIYSQKYLPKAQLVVLEKGSDNTAPLVAASSGQADAGLIMSDVVSEYVKLHPEVKDLFAEQPYSTTPIAWATRQNDQELLNFLNNGIDYLKSVGFLDATAKKHSPAGWYGLKQEYVVLS